MKILLGMLLVANMTSLGLFSDFSRLYELQEYAHIESFRYCAGSYLLYYQSVRPLGLYNYSERRYIRDWIVFKCGPRPYFENF